MSESNAEFWDQFVAETWGKETRLFEDFDGPHTVETAQLYDMLMRSLDAFVRERGGRPTVRLYLDSQSVSPARCDERGYVPEAKDRSVQGYFRRVVPKFGGKEYCLIVDRMTLCRELREWVYGVGSAVYRRLGYIAPASMGFMLFGAYSRTPFGVHCHDDEEECDHTFVFTLAGERRLWVWPEAYTEANRSREKAKWLESHKQGADSFRIRPGALMYFPADRLHVGSCQDHNSLALFIAFKEVKDCVQSFIEYAENVLKPYADRFGVDYIDARRKLNQAYSNYRIRMRGVKQRNRKPNKLVVDIDTADDIVENLPEEISYVIAMLEGCLPAEALNLMGMAYWLSVLSSYGFVCRPIPRSDLRLEANDRIKLFKNHRLYASVVGNELLLGVGGENVWFEGPTLPLMRTFMCAVNTKEVVHLASILDSVPAQNRETALRLIERVVSIGIFDVWRD